MRQYTLVFMEPRIGVAQLTPIEGEAGVASFAAMDDEAALAYITQHLIERLKNCACAELSSLRIMTDPAASAGSRLVDDSHANPHFQDTYVKYNAVTKAADLDFESTRTALIVDLPGVRTMNPRAGTA
jgi:hypothetical protein